MRPRYAFETKKPTKSAVYRKPTNFSPWSKNGTRIKFTQKKAASLHSETASKNK